MARLIDADALLKEHCEGCMAYDDGLCSIADPICGAAMLIAEAPTIDVAIVVRCRDCIYCHSTISANGYPYLFCEQWDDLPTEEDGFCSRGVRREDGKIN